ncbi:MAG: TIGR02757 family protein [Chitinispirillales bacterium]|nr:TIGR02757 family protein [Chitinispirillales bacterium]
MSSKLKTVFDDIYANYHHPRYLGLDPLVCVRQFSGKDNREAVGLLAAVLAYGRVEIIVRNVNTVINLMGGDPAQFIRDTSYRGKLKLFDRFKHRFNDGQDISALLESIKIVTGEYGSLENCFVGCMARSDGQLKKSLTLFIDILKNKAYAYSGNRASFDYLLPSPARGSACKRPVLYLRWMIRADDGIDLGVWNSVSPSCLIMPVDTHVAKIARGYGLTSRKSVDWKMAEEITARLREFDIDDPVRYDFSLCHAGMVDFRK